MAHLPWVSLLAWVATSSAPLGLGLSASSHPTRRLAGGPSSLESAGAWASCDSPADLCALMCAHCHSTCARRGRLRTLSARLLNACMSCPAPCCAPTPPRSDLDASGLTGTIPTTIGHMSALTALCAHRACVRASRSALRRAPWTRGADPRSRHATRRAAGGCTTTRSAARCPRRSASPRGSSCCERARARGGMRAGALARERSDLTAAYRLFPCARVGNYTPTP